jgi:septum site-determining protein MinC
MTGEMMSQPVTVKAVKSGLIVKLADDVEFEELLPRIEKKFRESASFYGTKHMVLAIEGRDLNDDEAAEVLRLLVENTKLKVDTVMVQNKVLEDKFQSILGEDPRHEREIGRLRRDNATLLKAVDQLTSALDPMNIQVHRGTLRSGNDIEALGSIMVLGDVKPGATVTAGGSIFVMGTLAGIADAGAYGDSDAFVMALKMDPLQIRISDAMAVAQEKKGAKRRGLFGSKDGAVPEVASIVDGHIMIQDFDNDFLKGNAFFRPGREPVSPLMDSSTLKMLSEEDEEERPKETGDKRAKAEQE